MHYAQVQTFRQPSQCIKRPDLRTFPQLPRAGALGLVDVIPDYVYGAAVVTVFNLITTTETDPSETEHVGIGTMSQDVTLPLSAQTLRSKRLKLGGSGPGSYLLAAVGKETGGIIKLSASSPKPTDIVPYSLNTISEV
ncbi:alcohol dehydrogenase [Ophiostoma piceae UAMH 11346]|uniref:Alcohol dehydrogenase n=1 Tax=Ophiostoma piceae (strain UAMH 11346) TaxID=1262450 RepID=S3C9K6_OPHP1|nr:alcohol dehydrogenase [Ophiostoma piceae UAMH 11346]